ncbi:MAG: tetratricopeptide repeat protein, partial [Cyanobacteria bacterium J06592_8]
MKTSWAVISLVVPLVGSATIPLLPSLTKSVSSTETPTLSLPGKKASQLFQQGRQQYRKNEYKAALQSWQEALKIYREIDDRKGVASSLNNLGNAYRRLGQYQEAIEYY